MATAAKPETTALARNEELKGIALLLDRERTRIEAFLPEGVKLERVIASVRLEVMKNPAIAECTPLSIVQSVARTQQWGLDIGVTCYLVPFNQKVPGTKDQYEKVCTAIMGYTGMAELMIASKAVRHVEADCVYEGDHFTFVKGLAPELRHIPTSDRAKRGKMTGAYCIIRLPFMQSVFEYMSIEDIEAIRGKHSKQWTQEKVGACPAWYAKKTVVRQAAKLVPKNPRIGRALEKIEKIEGEEEQQLEGAEPRVVQTATATATAAVPPEGADWTVDDDEPAVLESAAQATAATSTTEPTTDAGEPECPTCGGPMWDNRPKKASGQYKANAPDFGCKVRDCGGKLWPGQWPPKPKDAGQEELAV